MVTKREIDVENVLKTVMQTTKAFSPLLGIHVFYTAK